MTKQIRAATLLALLTLLSNAAFGLGAVCGENPIPANGADARNEQLIWSYYDYWYSGIYLVDEARVEETVPADTAYYDTNLAAQARAGDVVMVGYPAAWGVEAFVRIDCLSSQQQADADAGKDAALAEASRAPIALLCSADADCVPLPSSLGQDDTTRIPSSSTDERAQPPLASITGTIHTAADGVLIVQTATGRYATMTLPADVRIERHTAANLDALRSGDIVGAVVGGTIQGSREATEVRLYRGALRDTISVWRQGGDTAAPAGFELRGVVRNTARRTDGGTIRIGYATLDSTLQIAREIPVTIIEAADASALQPFTTRVRVHARRQGDGSLLVRAIDIL